MIIVQLKGGLGNQLFQYSAAYSLGRFLDVPVKVDASLLKGPDDEIGTVRHYELQHLISPATIASQDEINELLNEPFLIKYLRKLTPPHKRIIYKEASFNYDQNFFKAKKNVYLKGYRQSEKYFKRFEKEIREQLFLKSYLYEMVRDFGEALQTRNSISIHIRQGDYTNEAVKSFHGMVSKEYYLLAIEALKKKLDKPVFYIFTDNPDWVKENFSFQHEVHFVSGQVSQTHYEDLYLMSQCKHNIIANSSFSWWAAWFNSNPNKTVIAPLKWFDKANLDTSGLIPDEWIRI